MPLIDRSGPASAASVRCAALVAIPTFEAAHTIEDSLASVEASIRFHRDAGSTDHVVISVVDDASDDDTVTHVRAFAEHSECLVVLSVQPVNRGRAAARNRAVATADADALFFLDHDDRYEPEHIQVCLDVLASHPHADYVQTRVALADPVHPDWGPRIDDSLTQNLCVRARCHRLIGGFHEEPEVEAYGCDDVLYNRTLHAMFHGVRVPRATVHFARRPGNSLDRQYERKFSRPFKDARLTASAAQRELADDVLALQQRRQEEVGRRLDEPVTAVRAARWSAPFDHEGEPIFAMMVVGDDPSRAPLAQVAVASFAAQRYGNRILVVVKGNDHPLDLSAIPEERRIMIRPSGHLPLGALRNLGLDAIPDGALWTYWDDDDWYHPRRLSAQRKVLDVMGVSACLLTGQVTYSLPHDVAYVNRSLGGFAGTLLSRKRPSLRFAPSAASGEDSTYLQTFKTTYSWYPWQNPPELMVRMFHGANTHGAKHFGLLERSPGTWRLSQRSERVLRAVIDLCRHQGVAGAPSRPAARP